MTETNSQLSEYEMKRYLYGEVSDDELAEIEDKIFIDDDLFYLLSMLENKLVDQYVRGKLKGDELSRFEKSLEKVPERRAKVANAIALQTYIEDERPLEENEVGGEVKPQPVKSRFPFFRVLALGVAGIFLLILIPVILIQNRSENDISHLRNTNSASKPMNKVSFNGNLSAPPNVSATVEPTLPVISTTLKSLKEVPIQNIKIGNNTTQLSLRLPLPEDAASKKELLWVKLNGRYWSRGLHPEKESDGSSSISITIQLKDLYDETNTISIVGPTDKEITQYKFTLQKR